jgi:hypothetical protein
VPPSSWESSRLPVLALDNISICVLLYWVNGTLLSLTFRNLEDIGSPEEPPWMALAGGPLCQLMERMFRVDRDVWRKLSTGVIALAWSLSATSRWVRGGDAIQSLAA